VWPASRELALGGWRKATVSLMSEMAFGLCFSGKNLRPKAGVDDLFGGKLCNVDQPRPGVIVDDRLRDFASRTQRCAVRFANQVSLSARVYDGNAKLPRQKVFVMAANLSACHPGDGMDVLHRLPGLAEPLLQVDLERELQLLRQEDSWQRRTGRSSKTLAKYPDFRIVLILMKGGTRMRQHRAEGRISIQQLKGQVCVHLADRKVSVSAGQLLMLDCGVLHDVEALEESALLLTISWRRRKSDVSGSSSSTDGHLDEEALLRMDDEGGALYAA
jgi:quercetin dioxygenase-like cupin family protein